MVEQFQGDKEKLDLLKREEVRTMEKDIAKLRRKEVEQERKRIADIKIEQTNKGETKRLAKIKAEQAKEEERKRLDNIKIEQKKKEEEEKKRLDNIKIEQKRKEEEERKRLDNIKIEQKRKEEEEKKRLANIKIEQKGKEEEEKKRLAAIKIEQEKEEERKRLSAIKIKQEKKEEEKRLEEQEQLRKVKAEQERKEEEKQLEEEKRLAEVKAEQGKEEEKKELEEQERLAKIKIEQEKEKEKHQLPKMDRVQISVTPEIKTPEISVSRPLSQEQKVIIRVIVGFTLIFFLINAGLFLYWWYFIKQGVQLEPADQKLLISQPITLEPTTPFIPTEASVLLSVTTGDILPQLSQLLIGERIQGLTEIRLQDTNGNVWDTSKIFEGLGIIDSQNIGENLENTMVFIHRGEQKRIGLIIKSTVPVNMDLWEETLEFDTVQLFTIIGNKDSGYTQRFRSTTYLNIPIRFQTFSTEDLGIVYATINDYIVLTSSFESMEAAINILNEQ